MPRFDCLWRESVKTAQNLPIFLLGYGIITQTIERVFRPTDAEVEYARRVVDAFEAVEAGGAGAVAVDGQMVDLPVVERARRALQLVSEDVSTE